MYASYILQIEPKYWIVLGGNDPTDIWTRTSLSAN